MFRPLRRQILEGLNYVDSYDSFWHDNSKKLWWEHGEPPGTFMPLVLELHPCSGPLAIDIPRAVQCSSPDGPYRAAKDGAQPLENLTFSHLHKCLAEVGGGLADFRETPRNLSKCWRKLAVVWRTFAKLRQIW